MKNLTLTLVTGLLAIGLTMYVFAAQGPGGGCGMRAGQQGKVCPMGNTQPGGAQGGWWNTVKPTTPAQKAFVAKVKALHEQIRSKQLDIAKLQKNNADKALITKAQDDLKALRTNLQTLMNENKTLRQQMGGVGNANCTGKGNGNGNGNCGTCPNGQAGRGQGNGNGRCGMK